MISSNTYPHRTPRTHILIRAARMTFTVLRIVVTVCMAIIKPITAFIAFSLAMMTMMD